MTITNAKLVLGAAFCAAVGAAAVVAVPLWKHRLELFVLPPLWRDVCRLREAGRPDSGDEGRLTSSQRLLELSPLDVAACRLIRAQRREFICGRDFTFFALRTDEGKPVWLVQYEPVDTPFDAVIGREDLTVCYPTPYVFRVLDATGRLLGDPSGCHHVDEVAVQTGGGGRADVARVSTCCGPCEFSADAGGIVPRGRVTDDELGTPLAATGAGKRSGGRKEVENLLGSGHEGDLYRALERIEQSGAEFADLATSLLAHPDERLRARAASVLATDAARADKLRPLLGDPSPQVRRSALHALAGAGGWEEALLPLAADPHPLVAIGAHRELVGSEDPQIVERSGAALLRAHDLGATAIDFERLHTPAIADALVSWLEADCRRDRWDVQWSLKYFASADLEPLVPRLAAAYERWEEYELPRDDIAITLARLDHPLADDVLARTLGLPAEAERNPTPAVLQAFLERRSPPTTPAAVAALDALSRSGGCLPREEGPWSALLASIILAGTGVSGAAAALRHNLLEFEGEWCREYHPLLVNSSLPLPPGAIPTVLDLALAKSGRFAAASGGFLAQSTPAELRPHLSPLVDLYRLLEAEELPCEALAARLATMADRSADEALARSLLRSWSDDEKLVPAVLRALLDHREPPLSEGLIAALEEIAAASGEEARAEEYSAFDWWSPVLPEDVKETGEGEAGSSERPEYLEFVCAVVPSVPGEEIEGVLDLSWPEADRQVAATLILVRAGVTGAVDRLLDRVAAPGSGWAAHRALWERLPPEHLPRLRDAALTDPGRFEKKLSLVIRHAATSDGEETPGGPGGPGGPETVSKRDF